MSDVNLPDLPAPPGNLLSDPRWPELAGWAIQFAAQSVIVDRASDRRPPVPAGVVQALEAIVNACDDPNGSEYGESLACAMTRLLPAARAALASIATNGGPKE